MMKLKTVRYFGRFYEIDGHLGWMPWHKVIITEIICPGCVNWVSQSQVQFTK